MNIKTEIKPYEDTRLLVKNFAASIIDTIHEPFLLLNADKQILYANASFYDTFKVKFDETIGKIIYNIGTGQWDIPKFHTLLDEILEDRKPFNGFEVEFEFPTIGHKIMLLNARMVQLEENSLEFIFLAIDDITEIRRRENEIKEYEARYRRQFDTAHDGLLLLDYNNGKIVNSNPAISKLLGYSNEEFNGKTLQDIGLIDNEEFQKVLLNLKDFGFVHFDYIAAKTKEGKNIDTELYLVDRTKLIQCNVRNITERKKKEVELRIYNENLVKMADDKNKELERFNKLFVDRELRIKELKKKVNELEEKVASVKQSEIPP